MIQIDGKTIDLTNPSSWGDAVQIKQGGYIQETKDGVTTRVELNQPDNACDDNTKEAQS
jgi:hypothetical protein